MLVRISKFFSRAVSVILCILLMAGVGSFICTLEHKSYPVAFAAAACIVVCLFLYSKKSVISFDRWTDAKLCGFLAVLCFVWSTVWILFVRVAPTWDFGTFWAAAKALAHHERISLFTYIAMFPHIFGYSWFLSLFIRIFGDGSLLAPFINVFLTTGSCIVIFLLCLRWYGKKEAVLAAVFWILCPSKSIYNTMVLSEPLYTNLLLIFLYIVSTVESKSNSSARSLISAAVLGLLSALILRMLNAARPIAAVPIIALYIWVLLLRHERLADKNRWLTLIVFCFALILLYIPSGNVWAQYMSDRLGIEPSSVPGYSMYVGFNEENQGAYNDEDMNLFRSLVDEDGMTPQEAQEEMLELTKERIVSGKINFPRLILSKLSILLGNDEGGAYYAKDFISSKAYQILAFLSNIYYYILIQLTIVALVFSLHSPDKSCCQLVSLYIVGLILAQMLVEVSGRYHYSIIPMLAILAATAFSHQSKHKQITSGQ